MLRKLGYDLDVNHADNTLEVEQVGSSTLESRKVLPAKRRNKRTRIHFTPTKCTPTNVYRNQSKSHSVSSSVRRTYPFLVRNLRRNKSICTGIWYELIEVNKYPVHTEKNNIPCARLRLEYRQDWRCPICHFLLNSLTELKSHLPRFHRDNFTSTIESDHGLGCYRIKIVPTKAHLIEMEWDGYDYQNSSFRCKVKEGDRFCFVRSKSFENESSFGMISAFESTQAEQQRIGPEIPDGWERRLNETLPDPWPYKEKKGWGRGDSRDADGFSQISPECPKRQYFHSKTRHPMRPGAWEFDSDDEADEEWIMHFTQGAINDFDDITSKEKRVLRIWIRHMRLCEKETLVSLDDAMPLRLFRMIRGHINALRDCRMELLWLMTVLVEAFVISDCDMLHLMEHFDIIKKSIIGLSSHNSSC